jgi:hypothetical protein
MPLNNQVIVPAIRLQVSRTFDDVLMEYIPLKCWIY